MLKKIGGCSEPGRFLISVIARTEMSVFTGNLYLGTSALRRADNVCFSLQAVVLFWDI